MRTHDRIAIPLIAALQYAGVISIGQMKKIMLKIEMNVNRREEDILADINQLIAEMDAAQSQVSPLPSDDKPVEKTGFYTPTATTQRGPKMPLPTAPKPQETKSDQPTVTPPSQKKNV